MAQYPSITTTYAGLNMIAESQTGKKLIFTKLKAGDGSLSDGESIQSLTALKSPKLDIPIQGFVNQGNGQIRLRFVVSNENVESGFHMKEVAIYAKLEESGEEQLYAYVNGGNFVDWIPDKNIPMEAQIFDIFVIIGNASSVIVNIDKSIVYATALDLTEHNTSEIAHEDIRKKIGTDITNHNANKDAHQNGIKGNAATATKLQTPRKINGVAFDGTTDINIVADGGNADTVDGKHATDFMRYMGYFSNAMFKDAEPNTVYTVGGATTDMPAGAYNYGCLETTGTSKKMVQRYTTHGVDGSTGQFASWYRVSYGGDYSAWKKIATITDNAATATKLQTARSITVGNATKNFDGSANVGFSLAEMGISASAMGGIVAQSLGETGWVKFANGLIMQWGTVSANFTADNETKTITLPISFTSQHLFCSISETVGYVKGDTIVGVDIYSKSNENFIVKYCWDKAGEVTIRFFCIGV